MKINEIITEDQAQAERNKGIERMLNRKGQTRGKWSALGKPLDVAPKNIDQAQATRNAGIERMLNRKGQTGGKWSALGKPLDGQASKDGTSSKPITKPTTRSKGGGRSAGGGGGKFGWIRRSLHRPGNPWSLLRTNKNF